MFTQDQINEWIEINATGDNNKDNEIDYWSNDSLSRKLVEAKVLTDRWGNCAADIIFHSSHKEFVRQELADKITHSKSIDLPISALTGVKATISELRMFLDLIESQEKSGDQNLEEIDHLWGATIHYLDDCPVNKGIMIDLSPNNHSKNGRNIVIFPM